jgi:hypothetical protein
MPLTSDASSIFHPACSWIGLADWRDDARIAHPHPFRFGTRLTSPAADRLVLKIACTPYYVVYWNGELIHEGPARALRGEVYADVVHLPCDASIREHVLAIIVMPPSGMTAYQVHDRIGLLAQVDDTRGETLATTDATWTVRHADEISFHGRVCSIATSQQEHWTGGVARVALSDAGAVAPRVLGSVGTPPWLATLARDCPLLQHPRIDFTPVYQGLDNGEQLPAGTDLARAFVGRTLTAVRLEGDDETANEFAGEGVVLDRSHNVVTIDVGRTRLVRPVVRVLDAPPGGRIEVFYDIGLVDRPRASLGFETPAEGFADSVACEGTPLTWRPIAPRGARYVTFRYSGPGRCRARLGASGVECPQPARTSPTFDRWVLQAIWDRSVATLRSGTIDVIVDTCWRENVLWTFDAAVTGKAHFVAFGDPTLWRRCLGLIARWAGQSGDWPTSVVPAGSSGVILPDQTLRAIVALGDYARLTGDDRFARVAMAPFDRFLKACARRVTPDGLFVPPDWCWHWIDWAPVDRRPYSLPINLLLMMACETYAKFSDPAAGAFARDVAGVIRGSAAAFWDDAAGCYRDREVPAVPRPEPNQVVPMPSAEVSAHANAMALEARLGTETRLTRVAGYLAARLPTLPFGPGWTDLVLGPLIDRGHGPAALRHLERLFGPWIEAGQPTWSESFGQVQYVTAHAWGATAISALDRARRHSVPIDNGRPAPEAVGVI